MHRIFNDINWVKSKTPEQTREQLEGWLPKQKWGELNALFVGFGQESQQQKEKILKKALASSRAVDALGLLKKVGLDIHIQMGVLVVQGRNWYFVLAQGRNNIQQRQQNNRRQ